ncbi:MAG: phosphatidate cytidylyltransferase [Candidatus Stahlbacteria bacterium]|nr:phosphatidate cytidylyltransferase [Candidatus Stahlbacteria bacterium]
MEDKKTVIQRSELFYRILLSALFIPVLIFIAWAGGIYYLLLIELCIGVGAYEFFNILESRGLKPYTFLGVIAALVLGWSAYFASYMFTFLTLTMLLLIISVSDLCRKTIDQAIYHISANLFGVFYVGWLFSHLTLLRQIPVFLYYGETMKNLANFKLCYFFPHIVFTSEYTKGAIYTLIPFVLAWANDSGAYFIGHNFGKHKVLKRISPGKSWEGLIGGGVCGLIGIFILKYSIATELSAIDCLILGILSACAAPVGDLVESLLKRDAQVKNASNTIPGHGGMLDRFDSILFVAPIVYYYLRFFVVK